MKIVPLALAIALTPSCDKAMWAYNESAVEAHNAGLTYTECIYVTSEDCGREFDDVVEAQGNFEDMRQLVDKECGRK